MNRRTWLFGILGANVLLAQGRIQNAALETRAVSGTLLAQVDALVSSQDAPLWIGYAVASVPGDRHMCCFYDDGQWMSRGCGLEDQRPPSPTSPSGPVQLEPPKEFHVLIRAESKQIGKLRTFSPDCELDAGGVRVVWLTGVKPAEHVALMERFIASEPQQRQAISALAITAGDAAYASLRKLLAADQPESIRSRAASSIASMRGAQGFDTASQLIKTDSSERVREQTIRGLSVNKDPRVQPLLSELARTDSSARVRSEALSALARKGGPQILSILEEAIEKDPEEKVKRRAVHALSEMPQGQGIPALIRLARNKTANHKLRSEAMQWLGSSRDPRALSFVAEILAK